MDSRLRIALGIAVTLAFVVTYFQSKQDGRTYADLENRYAVKAIDSAEVAERKNFQREPIRYLVQLTNGIDRIYLLMSLVMLAVIFGA
jgi:hypothetical protein